MMRTLALLAVATLLPAHAVAQTNARPLRIVLIVDSTEGIRQPIGLIRKALAAFVEGIDPQQISHVANHFADHGGTLHAIRLIVPTGVSTFRGGNMTEMPVSLMIARDTNGAYTDISPNGLLDVLQRLAAVINDVR